MQSLWSLGWREAGQGSRCREAALAASCGKGGHERCSGSAEGGGTASGMSQLSKKGSAKLLGPRAGPWLRDLAPQQPLVNTLIKNVQQLLKDKTKGFGVPCEHSPLQEEDELLPGDALPDGSKGQGWHRAGTGLGQVRTQTQLSWHSQTTTWASAPCTHSLGGEREWPQIPQAVPRSPEMYRSYYSISPFSRLKCGNCTFLKAVLTHSVAHGHRAAVTAPLILPFPSFSPLFRSLDQLETGQAQAEGLDRGCAEGRGWRLKGSSCWSSWEEVAEHLTPALVLHSQMLLSSSSCCL